MLPPQSAQDESEIENPILTRPPYLKSSKTTQRSKFDPDSGTQKSTGERRFSP